MKRTILALAIAGLSAAAFAAPPLSVGPPGPIAVTVTNPVVQVEVSNEAKILDRSLTQAVHLKAISGSAEMTDDYGGCIVKFDVIPASGSRLPLYRLFSSSEVPSNGYLALPDLRLEMGDTIRVEVASGGGCVAVFSVIGVIAE